MLCARCRGGDNVTFVILERFPDLALQCGPCQRFATCVSDKIFSDRPIQSQLFQRDSILKMQSFIHYQFSSLKFRDWIRYSWYATQYVDVRPQAFTTPAQFCLRRTNQACEIFNSMFVVQTKYMLRTCY
jgi:hypothetical protein